MFRWQQGRRDHSQEFSMSTMVRDCMLYVSVTLDIDPNAYMEEIVSNALLYIERGDEDAYHRLPLGGQVDAIYLESVIKWAEMRLDDHAAIRQRINQVKTRIDTA